jgi:D-threo-aldose 1-dehydrogenase
MHRVGRQVHESARFSNHVFVPDAREQLRAVANQFGVDLKTAALQFSAAPDVVVSLVVGAHTEAQALANATSMKATIPQAFWAELKRQNLIEQDAPLPKSGSAT